MKLNDSPLHIDTPWIRGSGLLQTPFQREMPTGDGVQCSWPHTSVLPSSPNEDPPQPPRIHGTRPGCQNQYQLTHSRVPLGISDLSQKAQVPHL